MRKIYLFLLLFTVALSGSLFAQSGAGELRGKVADNVTNDGVPFAIVTVELNGTQVGYQQTDFDGNFSIKPINPGKYDVKVKIIGYNERVVNGVIVTSNKATIMGDLKIAPNATQLKQIDVTAYKVPVIEQDNTVTGGTITSEEIKQLPTRSINSLVSTTAGVYQAEEGAGLNVKGSRTDANEYYVDGVKVRGTSNLPQAGIEQISVITGGIPAQYGDVTGGIINITTKGPSREYNGGVEAVTSELLDGYHYNLVAANASGPLYTKDKGTENEKPLVGFFLSGEYEYQGDKDPSAAGVYQANDSYLNYIRENPLKRNPITGQVFNNAEYTRLSDLDKVKAQSGNKGRNFNYVARLDFQPSRNTTFAIGFNGSYQKSDIYNRLNMLFNSDKNGELTRSTNRVYGRFVQKFPQDNGSEAPSLIKNAFYTIQVDYSNDMVTQQDRDHKADLFNYGYLGKFDIRHDRSNPLLVRSLSESEKFYYAPAGDTIRHVNDVTSYGFVDTSVFFQGGGYNPYLENYNYQLYDYLNGSIPGNLSTLVGLRGMRNGDGLAQSVYGGLWTMPGGVYNGYIKAQREQYRVSASASADIKNHSIQFGVEYEQRVEAQYVLNPRALWTAMRGSINAHNTIDPFDRDRATFSGDTMYYALNDSGATNFSTNFRNKHGLSMSEYVDIDAYDPSAFSIDMFNASELIDARLIDTYYGYDYTGKRSRKKVSFADYFTDRQNRPVGAYQPIYMAGYIQDKFTFRDIIFNVGVRVDRFDANQPVLKDKYSIYETQKASVMGSDKPANIGDDFVLYVDDPLASYSLSTVKGFRNGDIWYDASGNVVNDPRVLANSNGRITPLLSSSVEKDPVTGTPVLSASSFKDYEPQVQVMPRISFSFPISDEANFFANYDVLTQRPRNLDGVISNPIDYVRYESGLGGSSAILISPDLRPEKTISYQFGFKQRVSQSSAITLTAFYRELKDNLQMVRIENAYPSGTYTSYANQDFGTITGLTVGYDLRRTNNVSLNAAYTLQFANGTGSTSTSANNMLQSNEGNIRIPLPLDNDQRHTIVTRFDYRYGSGADYNGPAGARSVLENLGANVIFRAGSGTPYSRISTDKLVNIIDAADTRFRTLIGSINGSRLPWEYNIDLRIDKDFNFTSNAADGKGKSSTLNVYVLVQNVLNTMRVASVYAATGTPDDDGYLTSPQGITYVSGQLDPQSYVDLYDIRQNNPNNYRSPRIIRLGASYSF